MDEAMHTAGATCLVERVDINKEDWTAVDCWVDAVCTKLPDLGLKTAGDMGILTGCADAGEKRSAKGFFVDCIDDVAACFGGALSC